jgi:HEAT repeat protein
MLFSEDYLYDEMDRLFDEFRFDMDEIERLEMEHALQEYEYLPFDFDIEFDELQHMEMERALQELEHIQIPPPPMPPDYPELELLELEYPPMPDLSDFEFEMPDIEFEMPDIEFAYAPMAPFGGSRGRSGMLELLEMTYQQQGDPGLSLYNEAKTLLFDEKYEEARRIFMDLATRFSQSTYVDDALFWAAWAQEHIRGQSEQAFRAYQEFLNRFSDSPFVVHARASMVKLAGELFRQGMEQYRQYIEEAQENQEEDIRLYALNALVQQEGAEVVTIIEGVLADGSASSRLKREAVDILRRDEDPRAVQALETAARQHADPEVRRRAIGALGYREEKAGFDALVRLYRNEQSVNARRYIVEATGRFRESDWAPETVDFLSRVARDDDNEDVRERALTVLINFDSALTMPHLIGMLESRTDPRVRRVVLSVISRSEDPRRISILMDEINNGPEEDTRRSAVGYLSRIEGPEALDALITVAGSNVTEAVRVTAVDEIGDYEGSKAAGALVEIARSNAPIAVRREALDELGNRRTSDSFGVLRGIALGREETALRESALSELRAWGAEAAPIFEQIALEDPEQGLRRDAVSALGRLEGGAGFEALVRIYENSEDTRIRAGAIDLLWRINEANSLDTVIAAAKSDSDPDIRRRAVQILGRSEDPKAQAALREILSIPPAGGR